MPKPNEFHIGILVDAMSHQDFGVLTLEKDMIEMYLF